MFNNDKFFIKYLGSFTYLLSRIENVVHRSVICQMGNMTSTSLLEKL